MNIYFISGLGADRRAFERIHLPEKYKVHYIDWLEPQQNESLAHYAERMAKDIHKKEAFALVGLSFGGIIAIEISTLYKASCVILISSISNKNELPWFYKALGKVNLHQTKFMHLFKQNHELLHWFFGTKAKRLKEYLNQMIEQTSVNYLQWSLTQILNWKQKEKMQNVLHLHGTEDKLFPVRYCKADKIIQGGGHFMVITHAKEISEIITEHLDSYNI
jgi:pimeloyl-ACP methyl ester carboxylesterase